MGTPTALALNRPITIFGFPKKALIVILVGLAIGIMTPLPKLLVAAIALMALVVTWYVGKDPVALLVWIRALFQKAKYIPTMRRVFRMEIKP